MNADGSAKYWHAKAEEARTRVDDMRDSAAKKIMMRVADTYEELAVRAEKRDAGK